MAASSSSSSSTPPPPAASTTAAAAAARAARQESGVLGRKFSRGNGENRVEGRRERERKIEDLTHAELERELESIEAD